MGIFEGERDKKGVEVVFSFAGSDSPENFLAIALLSGERDRRGAALAFGVPVSAVSVEDGF